MISTINSKPDVTINREQELYVISCGRGYTCLGFDVCLKWARGIAEWLGVPEVEHYLCGTMEAYELYEELCVEGRRKHDKTGERCPALLTPQLVGLEGKRVEVVDCDGEKRRFIVGKSTGWLPIHLEISRRNSSGGFGVTGAPFRSVRVVSQGR
jgi:hypothetical protein